MNELFVEVKESVEALGARALNEYVLSHYVWAVIDFFIFVILIVVCIFICGAVKKAAVTNADEYDKGCGLCLYYFVIFACLIVCLLPFLGTMNNLVQALTPVISILNSLRH